MRRSKMGRPFIRNSNRVVASLIVPVGCEQSFHSRSEAEPIGLRSEPFPPSGICIDCKRRKPEKSWGLVGVAVAHY